MPWSAGLSALETPKAMPAGASSPSRATQAGQVEGLRPDEARSIGPPG